MAFVHGAQAKMFPQLFGRAVPEACSDSLSKAYVAFKVCQAQIKFGHITFDSDEMARQIKAL